MRAMTSKYSGTCRQCGDSFPAGASINYDKTGGRGRKAEHVDCDTAASYPQDRPIIEITTASGTFYQRSGGRCEDAPCCGCCTF